MYDISDLVPRHPGGVDEIFRAAGKMGDDFFQEGHSGINPDKKLKKYEIGILKQ